MPKLARDGKIVDVEPLRLSDSCRDELKKPETVKLLTSTDREGVPHCVCKHTLALLEGESEGCLAFMEMIEGSQSSKNLLWNFDMKRPVALTLFNPGNKSSFQIKGLLYKYVYEGPVWKQFLKETWEMFPLAEPAGVWIIIPTEERNEDFMTRMKEEDTRLLPPHHQWFQYLDTGYSRRHGTAQR